MSEQQPKSAEVTGIEATLHDLTLQGATAGELAMARAILEPLDPEAAKRVRRVQEDLIDSSRLSGAALHETVAERLLARERISGGRLPSGHLSGIKIRG